MFIFSLLTGVSLFAGGITNIIYFTANNEIYSDTPCSSISSDITDEEKMCNDLSSLRDSLIAGGVS